MPKELTQSVVEGWVKLVKGKFNVRDIWSEIGVETPQGRQHLRVILSRMETKGIIASNGSGSGIYRKLDFEAREIDWQNADMNATLNLKFPFGEHEFCKIFPKSVIIVAGSKNAGKTAYMYNFIQLNMENFPIDLYNSETSPQQMRERFDPLCIPVPCPFKVFERYDNFADIIHPEHISVIDYLDLNSEVYLVGTEIDNIFRKLTTGAVMIGLQKPPPAVTIFRGEKKLIERDLAYGGGFTAKRAVLYISLGSNKLKLIYVKTPKQPRVNPNNMQWSFKLHEDGIHFESIQRSYGETE